MRRIVAGIVTLTALPVAPAAAELPLGAPRTLGTASLATDRAHREARWEIWRLTMVDPRSGRIAEIRLNRFEGLPGVKISVTGPPILQSEPAVAFDPASGADPRFTGQNAMAAITRSRGKLTFTVQDGTTDARIVLSTLRPGPAASTWTLGTGYLGDRPPFEQRLAWSVPVGAARADGSIAVRDQGRVDLKGWRASYAHHWGTTEDRYGRFLDDGSVHGPGGAIHVFGLNHPATTQGPGSRDGQFLGVLGRVTARGTIVCRPRVDRTRWVASPRIEARALAIRARCRGIDLRLAAARGVPATFSDCRLFVCDEVSPASAGRAGRGSLRVRYRDTY